VDLAKGMAIGFIVGVAAIGTAVALLYGHDDAAHERNSQRIAKLEAQVQQLEREVTTLSGHVAERVPDNVVPAVTPTSLTSAATITH